MLNKRALSLLTTVYCVGIMDNMKAELIHDFKDVTPDGGIIQMIVWKVPTPVPPTTHSFKYRLVYVMNGERVVGVQQ